MLVVSQLFIYPIKSLAGIELTSSMIEQRGLKYDRRWMLINENNRFLSQREHPHLALFKPEIIDGNFSITYLSTGDQIKIPADSYTSEILDAVIWDDTCKANVVSAEADAWFSSALGFTTRLVYMPDATRRIINQQFTADEKISSFADDYPALMIGQSSLDDLNSRLPEPVSMNRFRPNIVFTGGEAFIEDQLQEFTINEINFYGVKLCARCVMITVDQAIGSKGVEPLKTLAKYRVRNKKIYFGQNLLLNGSGRIHVGDEIKIKVQVPENAL